MAYNLLIQFPWEGGLTIQKLLIEHKVILDREFVKKKLLLDARVYFMFGSSDQKPY